MMNIKFLKDRIIFDGHSDTREECETITLMCDNLAKSKDFKTIKYESGYAEFEKVSKSKELKFAASVFDITIIFDSNISKVTFAGEEWTTSGTTKSVAITTQTVFTVALSSGYVINAVATSDTSSLGDVTNITDNTFNVNGIASIGNCTIAITSKKSVSPYSFKHYSATNKVP